MSWGLNFISELNYLFELVIFILQFFVGPLEILNFLFIGQKFFFRVSEIGQKLFVFVKNLSPLSGMHIAVGLFRVRSENIIWAEVNVMREHFHCKDKIFFRRHLRLASAGFLFVEGVFCLNGRGLLAASQREIKVGFGDLEGAEWLFQFFYFFL